MAETSGLLNRRRGITPTEGSNPSVSATANRPGQSAGDRRLAAAAGDPIEGKVEQRRILIVEDDPDVLRTLEGVMDLGRYAHEAATSARQALQIFSEGKFSAILLDLSLPDLDGSELIKVIRDHCDVPILVISGQLGEQRRVASLDLGADDFIPKPFMPGELLARIRAAIRRAAPSPAAKGDGPAVQFDPRRSFVRVRRKDVPLSAIEHKFLALLARQPGTAVENRRACVALWGSYSERTRKILYVIANRLRNKIEIDPANPTHIVAQYGIGYRLVE